MSYGLDASGANCYPGTTCLINKLDIRDEKTLQTVESEITYMKAAMLDADPLPGVFDFEHYKAIHRFLFCDLYEWAGEVRTTNISKKRTRFTEYTEIARIGTNCLSRIQEGYLNSLAVNVFCERIADLYHTINLLHPFREGNGRTERAFFTQLIRHYGYNINFSLTDTDLLMLATIQAAGGVMDTLVLFFRESITQNQ